MDKFIIAKATSVGQVRQVNEDSMTVFESPNGLVMAVCDGMGGQAAGDVASQLTVNIIENILTDNTFESPEEAIRRSVLAANQGVLNRTAQNPNLEGMGSTCVMLIIRNGKVHCGWVGDSRIYYISNHTIRQLSHDQSYVQEMVDRGEITPEEALNHPQKNEITNAIGLQGMIAPSTLAVPITPEPGSIFLLCSDGLSGMVDNARIERVVSNDSMTLQQKADRLVAMANDAGGLDNITVELVQFGSMDGKGTIADGQRNLAQKKRGKTRLYGFTILTIALIAAIGAGCYFFYGGNDGPVKKEVKKEVKHVNTKSTTQKGDSQQSSGSEKAQQSDKKNTDRDVSSSTTDKGKKSSSQNTTEKSKDSKNNKKKPSNEKNVEQKVKDVIPTNPETRPADVIVREITEEEREEKREEKY